MLAKQGQTTLRSTKYVSGDCTASMSLLAKAGTCQWVGQFLASHGSGHFDDIISGCSEASCILMYALVSYLLMRGDLRRKVHVRAICGAEIDSDHRLVSYPNRFLTSIFILRHRQEARTGLAHFLYGSSSTHATTDMQLIKYSREVISVSGAEMRTKPLLSHVVALAAFPRRVPWQRKGRIQRLK